MSQRLATPVAESATRGPIAAASAESAWRWWTLASLSRASFLLTLGDMALAVAQPSLGRDLGLGLSELEWGVNAYTLALSVCLLAGGLLTDRFGGRRVTTLGLMLWAGSWRRSRSSASVSDS